MDGEYRRLEMRRDNEGRTWGSSPALGMDLCWDAGRLRFYDPATGEFRRNMVELEAALQSEREAREDAQARIRQLEEELRRRQ